METPQVERLYKSYQEKAERAYRGFQETGIQAYHWRYNRYQDIADLANQVLSFNDERNEYLSKVAVARAILGERNTDPEEKIKSLRRLFNMKED